MERKQAIRLFRKIAKELGLENVKIRIVPMKSKVASISFKTRTLRLNSNAVKVLNEEQLKFVIFHELIHIKVKDANHGSLFLKELRKRYSEEEIEQIELGIIEAFIKKKISNSKFYSQ